MAQLSDILEIVENLTSICKKIFKVNESRKPDQFLIVSAKQGSR